MVDEKLLTAEELAERLALSPRSVIELARVERENCWTFPLSDAAGRIVGLNRRFPDGGKRIMPGHKAGLYLPVDLPVNFADLTLVVCEGGSDTAAGLDLGFWAVGRFSCTHGADLLRRLLRDRQPGQVVIVADCDEHGAGQRGAADLGRGLLPYARTLKIVTPPAKDLRCWKQAGANHLDLYQYIEVAEPIRLTITTKGQ